VPEYVHFIHPPGENFAQTMTDAERAVRAEHFELLRQRLRDGTLILAGPTLGATNSGIAVFEADDDAAAQLVMDSDPAIASGVARGEPRPFRVALLRGRDWRPPS